MTPFLKQVALHYLAAPDIQKRCFIFPNRRSLVFFKKYLGEALQGTAPILVPPLYTINDFFYKLADARTTDRLRLLIALYDCYKALNDKAEALDEFLFWGEVLIEDFDDIDKYLVDARSLMQNVEDFKAIQDRFEYLSESQREAIGHFLSHFRDASGKWKLNPGADDVKARFLRLWNLLFPLYEAFNKKLEAGGMSYEGKVYRALASRLKEGESVADILAGAFPEVEGFVFVGLNALSECERLVLSRMRDARLAEFSWDYVSPQIQDKANKSSFFMRQNIVDFPQAFPVEGGTGRPDVTVVSVPSGVGQAKLAPWILEQVEGDPVETAFVLPDEGLLLPLLNSIPERFDNVNVTMGYPMTGSAVFALLTNLGQMQLRLRHTSAGWFFYHREVREVLSSGLLKSLFTDGEKAAVSKIKADAKYYIPIEDLLAGPLMRLLFKPVVEAPSEVNVAQNHAVEAYFSDLLAHIGSALSGKEDYLELDFVARCHKQLNILQEMDLEVLPATHVRLLERLLQGISVPFRGEPLKGLQVMGPLETRALDFRNLVVLSANEGMFPRRSVSASFIPPELRRGFGLPTYEYQDAVWAYYFYRMIQRPQKVWLVYDNRTEGIRNGEESRYIKQLEYHFQWPLRRINASSPIHPVPQAESIPKTPEHVETIRGRELSASALQSYLACPAKFFYSFVEELKAPGEVSESLDAGMLGNVFHHVMQRLYKDRSQVSKADIAAFRKDTALIRRLIREEILREMHSFEVTGRNLVLENILQGYVEETLSHDLALLEEAGAEAFTIIGLEQKVRGEIDGFRFKGFVDRMDSYKGGEVRIVDYKTGRVSEEEILIDEQNAERVVQALFDPDSVSRPKIALQLFLYDYMAASLAPAGARIVNSIYSTARLFSDPLPDAPLCEKFSRLALEGVQNLLKELVNPEVPFRRTENTKTCEYCDFKNICGR